MTAEHKPTFFISESFGAANLNTNNYLSTTWWGLSDYSGLHTVRNVQGVVCETEINHLRESSLV